MYYIMYIVITQFKIGEKSVDNYNELTMGWKPQYLRWVWVYGV